MLLYNIPKYMHFKLAPELVAELARHENVVGIKDSSGDLELLKAYLAVAERLVHGAHRKRRPAASPR